MTKLRRETELFEIISIHMPHTWHDGATRTYAATEAVFQSTCHIRGMTSLPGLRSYTTKISIHMPHTWHDGSPCGPRRLHAISIHMPHTWHDGRQVCTLRHQFDISIHMPHTWHDHIDTKKAPRLIDFNPHATYVA